MKGPSPQAVESATPKGFQTEIIVGRVCENCLTKSYVPLPDANTGRYDVDYHVCNRNRPADRQGLLEISEKIRPAALKQMVDSWLRGHQKYLVAHRISLEERKDLSGTFPNLQVLKIDASEIKNYGNRKASELGYHDTRRQDISYIIRAIKSSGQSPSSAVDDDYDDDDHGGHPKDVYGWLALTDDELLHFLEKAMATAIFCQVCSRQGSGNNSQLSQDCYYYLKIVTPLEIVARYWTEQNALINSMRKEIIDEMYAELMSELKEECNTTSLDDPHENGEWKNYSVDLKEEPLIPAVKKARQQKPKKQRQQQEKQQQQEDRDRGIQPSRADGEDEAPRMLNQQTHNYPEYGLDNSVSAPHSDSGYSLYAIREVVDGPTGKGSWYLGLEMNGGVTRIWGFPGDLRHMMHPKSQEAQRQTIGIVHDNENVQQVSYGFEYPSGTMISFVFGLPPLEKVEMDMKGRETLQGIIEPCSFRGGKGQVNLLEYAHCKIESNKLDQIMFTISERYEFPWNYRVGTKLFAGRFRLTLLHEQDGSHSTKSPNDRKQVWALSRVV
jgi:hypothetical protein